MFLVYLLEKTNLGRIQNVLNCNIFNFEMKATSYNIDFLKGLMVFFPVIDLWKNKSLVFYFSILSIRIRFRGTYLGLLWTAIEPTLLFVFLYALFTSIRITTRDDFGIYLLIGIILYHSFSRGTSSGLASLFQNNSLLYSVNIKKEFFPVTSTTTSALLLLVEIGVFFALLPIFGFIPKWTIILLPLALGLLVLLILGFSYFLSIVHTYFRDIQPFWSILMTALFFVTPIFWYVEDAEGIALDIQRINPVGQVIELAHKIIFGEIPPLDDWLYTTSLVLAILVIGFILFRKLEKNIVERMSE